MYTERISERMFPAGKIDPDAYVPAVYQTGWVYCGNAHRIQALLSVGEMAQGATLDAQLWQASDALGTNAALILNKAGTAWKVITQLTAAGGDGDDTLVIECQTEELAQNGSLKNEWVNLIVTVAVGNVDFGAILFTESPRFAPVSQANYTEVVD